MDEKNEPKHFCPLLRGECVDGCVWRHNFTLIDDEGIESFSSCAMNIVADYIAAKDGFKAML